MFSLNRAQIVGNLTRDPEMRYTPNGQAVCSFSVATNRRWRDKDGNNQEATEFHNVTAWGKLAEIISQYTKKGNKIYVEGRLQTRTWEGQDGGKRNRTEIIAENIIFLTPKGATATPVSTGENPEPDIEEFPTSTETKESPAEPQEKPKKPKTKETKKEEESSEDDINLDEIPF